MRSPHNFFTPNCYSICEAFDLVWFCIGMVEGSGKTSTWNYLTLKMKLTPYQPAWVLLVLIHMLHQIQMMAHGKQCFPNFNKIWKIGLPTTWMLYIGHFAIVDDGSKVNLNVGQNMHCSVCHYDGTKPMSSLFKWEGWSNHLWHIQWGYFIKKTCKQPSPSRVEEVDC